jgi:hypothetical protein
MSGTVLPSDRGPADRLAQTFREIDWLVPAYLSVGFLYRFAHTLEGSPPEMRPEVMRLVLTAVYNPEYLASMFVGRYSKIIHVKDFSRQIDEAIKAYFSGYRLAAITALLPVVEGIVRKIATRQNRDVGHGTRRLNFEFDRLVGSEENSPDRYEERLVMLEGLRDFVRDRLLEDTRKYTGLNELNRHGILHGIYDQYGEDNNFFRLITILDLLCFSIGLIEGGVSAFAPEPTPESTELARHYRQLQQPDARTTTD